MIVMKKLFLAFGLILQIVGIACAQSNNADFANEAMTVEPMVYQSSASRNWDLIHTELSVSFDWTKRYMHGQAILDLKPHFYEQEIVSLDAKGMDILTVKIEDAEMPFSYDELKLDISLPKPYSRTDTLQLTITYIAKPYEREVGGSEAIEENRGLYFINADGKDRDKPQQIWTQGETEANSGWFPTIDKPNERSTQKMNITVDNKYKTLSNGLLTEQIMQDDGKRTDVWVMDQSHAPYLFMMAIGEFEIVHDKWGEMPLAYLMEPGFGQYAQDIFGNTPEMMTYFSELLGYPYPWKKYDQVVVRDYVSGAMENTSASLYFERLNVNSRYLIDSNWEDYIAHELMHQWFGDLVTCESWSNLTLNEGFATYAEYLWNQYKYGQDEADYNFLIEQEAYYDEADEEKKNLIRYFYSDREDMFDSHSYNKGAGVLHMLRNYVGDEAFFTAVKNYLHSNAFNTVELAQLRMAFEEVTGEDLNWFFDQWYFYAGHPDLEVRHTYDNDTLTLTIAQMQSEDETPIFRLPVFVDIWNQGKLFSYPILINDAFETYQFPMASKPDAVIFDSDHQLLAEIDHPKSEEEYYNQFIYDASLYSRIETMDSLYRFEDKKLIDQVLIRAFEDPYYVIRQRAIEYLMDEEVKLKKYEDQILKLVNDSVSQVSSYALTYLGDEGFEKYRSYFDKGLQDSSYLVASAAIVQYATHGEQLSDEFLERNKDDSDLNLVMALAEYYNNQKNDDSFQWFQNRIDGLDDNTLFFFIQAYAQKLLYAPEKYRTNAVPYLEDIARNNKSYLARFSAYQALVLMSDLAGVEMKIKDIRENEKDPRLMELYNNI